jgi:hypothetical protein
MEVTARFKYLCDLPSIHGAIDATQIHLQKTKGENFVVVNVYLFKFKGYNIHM